MKKYKLFLTLFLINLFSAFYSDIFSQSDAGPDQEGCTDTFTLQGNDPGTETGIWSLTSGNASIVHPTLYNTQVIVPSGTAIFRWTVDFEGQLSFDDVTIINSSFTVGVNPDDVTCTGSYNLLGTNPALVGTGTGSGTWTVVGGSGNIANPTAFSTLVTNLLSTGSRESIFRWTVVDGLCSSFAQVRIVNDRVTANGNGFMTCNSTATVIGNDPGLQGATGLWTVDNQTTQTIVQPTSFITNVGGLFPNSMNRFRWTVSRKHVLQVILLMLSILYPMQISLFLISHLVVLIPFA